MRSTVGACSLLAFLAALGGSACGDDDSSPTDTSAEADAEADVPAEAEAEAEAEAGADADADADADVDAIADGDGHGDAADPWDAWVEDPSFGGGCGGCVVAGRDTGGSWIALGLLAAALWFRRRHVSPKRRAQ